MEPQHVINIIGLAIVFLGGWIMRMFWDLMKQQKVDTEKVSRRVGQLDTLVAGDYVKREEFDRVTVRIFNKLDSIIERLRK